MTVNAVDATGLSPAQITALVKSGVKTVGRYLSHSSWKALNVGEVANLKAAGMQIFSIYESNPTKSSYFTVAQGKSDAMDAYNLAQAIGQPEGTAIYFTVDYDAQSTDLPNILAYFQAIKSVLKSYKIGAYGSYTVLNYLHDNNAADYWFQTVAWSNGQRCSFLNIYQFQTDKTLAGVSVDFDNLEQSDVGAWGQPQLQQASVNKAVAVISQIGIVTVVKHTVLRDGPSASANIIKALDPTDEVHTFKCYGMENDWFNAGAGWIHGGCASYQPL